MGVRCDSRGVGRDGRGSSSPRGRRCCCCCCCSGGVADGATEPLGSGAAAGATAAPSGAAEKGAGRCSGLSIRGGPSVRATPSRLAGGASSLCGDACDAAEAAGGESLAPSSSTCIGEEAAAAAADAAAVAARRRRLRDPSTRGPSSRAALSEAWLLLQSRRAASPSSSRVAPDASIPPRTARCRWADVDVLAAVVPPDHIGAGVVCGLGPTFHSKSPAPCRGGTGTRRDAPVASSIGSSGSGRRTRTAGRLASGTAACPRAAAPASLPGAALARAVAVACPAADARCTVGMAAALPLPVADARRTGGMAVAPPRFPGSAPGTSASLGEATVRRRQSRNSATGPGAAG